MAYRAVLFDFYGTLVSAIDVGPTRAEVLAHRGYLLTEEALQAYFEIIDALDNLDHREHSKSRGHYLAWERWRLSEMVRQCGVSDGDIETLVDELYASSKSLTLQPYDEVHEVLQTVRARGMSVAICSNWDWDLDLAVELVGLSDLVDVAVTSAQAGARKPHPRIFASTLGALGISAADALFVGDTWRADVEGPLAVGLRAVHLWRRERRLGGTSDDSSPGPSQDAAVTVRRVQDVPSEPPPLPQGVTRITDLWGLLDLL